MLALLRRCPRQLQAFYGVCPGYKVYNFPHGARTESTQAQTVGQPTSTPPDSSLQQPSHDEQTYHRLADLYIGGLWTRLESEMRQTEGEDFEYDINMSEGCLSVDLPDRSGVVVCKVPNTRSIAVKTHLHDTSEAGEDHTEMQFPISSCGFEKDGLRLHEYLEDSFAKHLKVQMDLKPEIPLYGPDPP